MKNRRVFTLVILLLSTTFFIGCSNDDNAVSEEVNLEEAKLSGFPLLGINPVSFEIKQPVIVNNREVEYGEINIVISDSRLLSYIKAEITSEELNLSRFELIPGDNDGLSYQSQSHIHTVVHINNEDQELLHYVVTITAENVPGSSELTLTDFRFEATKNSQLVEDVTIETRFTSANSPSEETIYLFVPEGTDFADLTPTLISNADKVYYSQDTSLSIEDVETPFPNLDTSFDFKYPKKFYVVLKDETNNKLKKIDVFVDVKNAISLENANLNLGDVEQSSAVTTITNVTTFKNVGNHTVTLLAPNTYEDKTPVTDANLIKAQRIFPALGLIPGESAEVLVHISPDLPESEYKTSAVFYTKFMEQATIIDDILKTVKLHITVNIKE